MDKKTRNIALLGILIAGVIAIGFIMYNYGFRPNSSDAPIISQQTTGKILLDGKVVPEKSADLGFIVPAKIKSISKKVGDLVSAGEILAQQESIDLQAQVEAAQSGVFGAQAELDKLGHDLKKEKLKLHGLSGDARRQQAAQISGNKDSIEVQKSAIVAAQNNLISAKAQLEKALLRAPFDGIIIRQDGEVGEIGGASALSIMTIASNEPLRKIEAFASDLDVANIKVGDSVQVVFDEVGNQKKISAKVSSIDPASNLNQGKSTYKVTLILDATDVGIRSGMHASISL